jgi:hypothetical protein
MTSERLSPKSTCLYFVIDFTGAILCMSKMKMLVKPSRNLVEVKSGDFIPLNKYIHSIKRASFFSRKIVTLIE